jgi:tetratricopeptide (TPR) repeat protein
VRLALALQNGGDAKAAHDLLRRLDFERPGDYWVNFSLALSLANHNPPRLAEALRHSTAAVALRPKSSVTYYGAAGLVRDSYRRSEPGDWPPELLDLAYDYAQRAIAYDPDNHVCLNLLGLIQHDLGMTEEAIVQLKRAAELAPEDCQAWHNLGIFALDANDLESAMSYLAKSVKVLPDNFAPHLNLGNLFITRGELEEGLREYEIAAKLNPDSAMPDNNRGIVFMMSGKNELAAAAFQDAIDIDPHHVHAIYNLGLAQSLLNENDLAIKSYKRVAALMPQNASVYDSLAISLDASGNFEEALIAWKRAIELRPDSPSAHFNLATAYARQRRLPDAMEHWVIANRLEPSNPRVHANMGRALEAMRRFDEANAAFEEAVRIAPEDVQLRTDLATSYYRNDRLEDCIEVLDEVLRQAPNNPRALRLLTEGRQIKQARELIPAILAGTAQFDDDAVRLQAAEECGNRKHYRASARLYQEVFKRDPSVAADLNAGYRYDAACWASLTGTGGDPKVTDQAEQREWRAECLRWLGEDLSLLQADIDGDDPVVANNARQTLDHWLQDEDLAPVRNLSRIGFFSEEEQADWTKIWSAVRRAVEP